MSEDSGVRREIPKLVAGCLPLFFLVLVLLGCQSGLEPPRPLAEVDTGAVDKARLSVFLNLQDPNGPGIRLQISGLEILSDGQWQSIVPAPIDLDSEVIGARQLFLGSRLLPFGNYERLRLMVASDSFLQSDGSYKDVSGAPIRMELKLPATLTMGEGDSRSLFFTWDTQASLESRGRIRPSLSVAPPVRQLPADLLYVACPEIDTIFVVRSDKNWVADSFGLPGQPTYLTLDPKPANQRLYVLASREGAVKVVDLSSQRVIDSFHIPLMEVPTFMTLSPDRLFAYVLDEKNSYLSRLDLLNGRLSGRVHIGYRPQFATYLVDRDLLAVSSTVSQAVIFLDPRKLTEIGRIRTGSSPSGLLAVRDQLVIAESGANTISVYDFATNQIQSRLTVGFTPRRLLADGSKIYVSNYNEGSISVILADQLGVGREIFGLGRPSEMAFNGTYHWLYVSDEQSAGLAIIDSATDRLNGYIELGARPLGLATIQ